MRRDPAVALEREQRISALLRSSYASAQLIELGKAEPVRAVHDQGVGCRNIEARFDDRGRQEHVVLAVVERRHDVVERGRGHLSVRDRNAYLRHMLVEEFLGAGEILDAWTHIERLAAAIPLTQQRLAHDQGIKRRNKRAHCQPVDRRRSDDGQIAHPG